MGQDRLPTTYGPLPDHVPDSRPGVEENVLHYPPNDRSRPSGSNPTFRSDPGDLPHLPVCEQQGCLVYRDRERLWIDVDGTGTVAEVRRYMGRRWAGPVAF